MKDSNNGAFQQATFLVTFLFSLTKYCQPCWLTMATVAESLDIHNSIGSAAYKAADYYCKTGTMLIPGFIPFPHPPESVLGRSAALSAPLTQPLKKPIVSTFPRNLIIHQFIQMSTRIYEKSNDYA